jgi:hypothetical protein
MRAYASALAILEGVVRERDAVLAESGRARGSSRAAQAENIQ